MKWAEREDKVFLTVVLPDAKNPKVSVDPNGTFTFSATAGTDNNVYELKLDLLDKINEEVRCFSSCSFTRAFIVCGLGLVIHRQMKMVW